MLNFHDGTFMTDPFVVIPNNPLGNSTTRCSFSTPNNAYFCEANTNTLFGRLQYASLAGDSQTRETWPVTLSYNGLNVASTTNGWKQYGLTSFNGAVSNYRYSRFLSLVQLKKDYTINFNQQPPSDMILSLSLPEINGDNSQYLSVSIKYNNPNVIIITKSDGTKTTAVNQSEPNALEKYVT